MINTEAVGSAVDTAKDAAKDVVSTAKGTALDTAKTVIEFVSFLRKIGANDIFGLVGLERRKHPLSSLAIFSSGVAVGTGIGLLAAPVSGKEARSYILARLGELRGQMTNSVERVADQAENVAEKVQSKAQQVAGQVQEKVEGVLGEGEGEETEEGRKNRRGRHQNAHIS